MADDQELWIARLTPEAESSVEALLRSPLGLDIWERHGDQLVVAATVGQLAEIERRRLARVERISTVRDFPGSRQELSPP